MKEFDKATETRNIELLKHQDAFLTAHFELVDKECSEVDGASPGGHDFPNFRLKTTLTLLRSEILVHREAIRHLIGTYRRIHELEQENTRLLEQMARPATEVNRS